MPAITTLTRLLEHDAWANRETLAALEHPPCPDAARTLLAHVVATEFLWLDRLQERAQSHPVWPDWSLEEIGARSAELPQVWRSFLDANGEQDLSRKVRYQNSRGERWSSTVGDVVLHVALHGAHHRGQIAAELRRAGREPPYVDFVHAARSGRI